MFRWTKAEKVLFAVCSVTDTESHVDWSGRLKTVVEGDGVSHEYCLVYSATAPSTHVPLAVVNMANVLSVTSSLASIAAMLSRTPGVQTP